MNGPQVERRGTERPLRICIDARITGGGALGGVEQFVIGLASGLSKLGQQNEEEYSFLTSPGEEEWLRPYVGGPCRLVSGFAATRQPGWSKILRRAPFLRKVGHRLLSPIVQSKRKQLLAPPSSDGLLESMGFDVVHFPTQKAFLTSLPSIYHPWDLQHLHLPENFTSEVAQQREIDYRAFCQQARMVVAATSWQKNDLISSYKLSPDKVRVVAPGPVVEIYPTPSNDDLSRVQNKLSLPERFVFYPAQTWPHKNHLRLLEALSLLRRRDGLEIPLVSSGKLNDFYPVVEKSVNEHNLQNQVTFLDFITPLELQCVYKLSRGMVFPTLFEGFGLPVLEAFLVGTPVVCSNVCGLQELVGSAALTFDPYDPDAIANALLRIWTDDDLCRTLAAQGKERVKAFTWDRTARLFRGHYRRISGRELSPEDALLIDVAPLS